MTATGLPLRSVFRVLPEAPVPENYAAHLARFGPRPVISGPVLIDELQRSGLTGRGGAGFPASIKWRAVAGRSSAARPAVVVANAAEREPASQKDRTLLVLRPHLVLDGLRHAAEAVGADRAVVFVCRDHDALARAISAAIAERSGDSGIPIEMFAGPARYVAGEETAVVARINGRAARPRAVPPRPFDDGVAGRPTLVHNVETLANAALIVRNGAAWFRGAGTDGSPGTVLVTVSGAVRTPGVHEVGFGTSIAGIVELAGGTTAEPQAVLAGGYFGRWLPATTAMALTIDERTMRRAHASIGAGVIMVLPRSACGVAETAGVLSYLAGESAGQCGPCHVGLPAMAETLESLVAGRGRAQDIDRLGRWAVEIRGRGACRHPDGATYLVASALEVFADEFRRHARDGACRASERPRMLPNAHGAAGWR